MKKKILSVLFAIAFFPSTNFGCSCALSPSFCESLTSFNGDFIPDLIMRVKIIESSSSSAEKEIKINQLIFGKTNQSKITISDFWHCQPFFNELKDGKEYIIALTENSGQFALLSCAIFLKIEDEVVKGKIAPGVSSIPYNELGNLTGCGNVFDAIDFKNSIAVFPNPTGGAVKIKNLRTARQLENLQVEIFDVLGRKMTDFANVDAILSEEILNINIERLAPGVYFFKLSANYREVFYKIVKQ